MIRITSTKSIWFKGIDGEGGIRLLLDNSCGAPHSFSFQIHYTGKLPSVHTFSIENAYISPFSRGWRDYAPFVSTDNVRWRRLESGYFDGEKFSFKVPIREAVTSIAWYPPYSLSMYEEWLQSIDKEKIGNLFLSHRDVPDYIHIGNKEYPTVVILARQHPGETMSSYVIEGIIEGISRKPLRTLLLEKGYSLLIFPLLNKSGVRGGCHRTNIEGIDLNRAWRSKESAEVSFVKHMMEKYKQIIAVFDIHGDEVSNINYVFYRTTSHNEKFHRTFINLLSNGVQGLIPLPAPSVQKRFVKHLFKKRKILDFTKWTMSEYVVRQVHTNAYTIELSAHSTDEGICRDIGKELIYTIVKAVSS